MIDEPAIDKIAVKDIVNGRTLQIDQDHTNLYVWAAVTLSFMTILAIVIIAVLRPDSGSIISTIIGVTVPSITVLIAIAIKQVKTAIDGRLTQLLLLTEKASKAEGKLEGNVRTAVRSTDGIK